MLLQPDTLLQNRYTVMRVIGQGGMGAVYEVMDHRLKCRAALKQMIMTANIGDKRAATMRSAFEREAQLLARLHHPVLVTVIDFFTEGADEFLVMQFVSGDDLETLLERNGTPFAQDDVLRWADWLLDALDYLHSQHPPMVHRDIKPKNLKLTPRGEIIMLDLGLSKSAVRERTTSSGIGVRGYTTGYAPLEQIQGAATDPRSDLYALAATLYHLLTGEAPPDALTRAAAALSGQPDPLRPANATNDQVSTAVAAVLDQAMSPKLSERFVSANALRNALRLAQHAQTLPLGATPMMPHAHSGGMTTVPVMTPGQVLGASTLGRSESPALAYTARSGLPPTVIVGQQDESDYTTIGEAIARTPPGGRILVRPGHYTESLVLDKSLEIIGDGPKKEIIVESSDAPCILMATDYALVRGIVLRGWAALNGHQYVTVDIPHGRLVLEECDITSDTLACIAIHGATANPVLWRCRIHDGKSSGILVYDHGQGVVEQCDIAGHAESGILIRHVGNPVIRQCKIHHGEADGIIIDERGAGTIEGCNIFEQKQRGIFIARHSNPLIRLCKIHHQYRDHGIVVIDRGEGIVEGCDIFANAGGIAISQRGNTLVRRCKIHQSGRAGVIILEHGEGTIEECELSENQMAGIEICAHAHPTVRKCTIQRNGTVGIHVHTDASGTIIECDIAENRHGAWDIAERNTLLCQHNRPASHVNEGE